MQPETVIRWHRTGFRRYWRWISRRRAAGRPTIDPAIRDLVNILGGGGLSPLIREDVLQRLLD